MSVVASFCSFGANITMTNTMTNDWINLGSVRTNVLICRLQLDSDVPTFGSGAVGHLSVGGRIVDPTKNHTIGNIRCLNTESNFFDNAYLMGGYSSNDGTVFAGWLSFQQYAGYGAFNPQPGSPVTINIVADLGSGWETGDRLLASVDWIKNIIAEGNYWSPVGVVSNEFVVVGEVPIISSIMVTNSSVSIVAYAKPNVACTLESSDVFVGQWQKTATNTTSASGVVTFENKVDPLTNQKFFRVGINQ